MLVRPQRNLEVISISALDLFASALGVFILMATILFPYYLKEPSVEADLRGARQEMRASGLALSQARQIANDTADAMAEAESLRSRAIDELQKAEASKVEAESVMATAARRAKEAEDKKASLNSEMGNIFISDLDLVFVMDATGSMHDAIRDVQVNLLGIIRVLHRLAPSLNVGFVAYKDRTDEYLTRTFQLTPMTGDNLLRIKAFVERLTAGGGGDWHEPVGEALKIGTRMAWRPDALGWIIVVGDAPTHPGAQSRALQLAERFHRTPTRSKVARRVSVIYTSKNKAGRDFFERLARAGGGDFVTHRGRMIESVLLSVLKPGPR